MSEVAIDQLEVEITSDASKATANLDTLAASLEKLGAQVTSTTPKMQAFVTALKGIKDIKISSTVGKNIGSLAEQLGKIDSKEVKTIGDIEKALEGLSGIKISSTIGSGLTRVGEALKTYQNLDMSKFASEMAKLNTEIERLANSSGKLGTNVNALPRSLRTAGSMARSVSTANKYLASDTDKAANSFVGFNSKLGRLTSRIPSVLGMAVGVNSVADVIAKCVNESNTYIESMNLFNASMGQYAEEAYNYSQVVQEAMGIDAGEWMRNQGVFQTLISGMGQTSKAASVMSQQLTQLGYDIASFYNISVSDAMLKIQSGIAGELEPLRRLGWDLSDARMQLELTRLGIEATTQEMTQADKVALRYYLIMTQVTQTHGDMARTIASPANQLRVLQSQVTLAARAIGDLLIPTLNMILPYAIGAVKGIRLLAKEIANFFGIDASFEVDYSTLDTSSMDGIADSWSDAAKQTEKANKKAKEYKNTVMGFDELNKLNDESESDDSSKNGDDGSGIGLDLPLQTYDFMEGLDTYITDLSDGIAKNLVEKFKSVLPFIAGIGAGIAAWKLGPSLLSGLGSLYDHLRKSSIKANDLAGNLKKAGNVKLGGILGNVSLGLMNAASGVKGVLTKITPMMGPIAIAVGAAALHFANLYENSENFRRGLDFIVGGVSDLLSNTDLLGMAWDGVVGFVEGCGDVITSVLDSWNIKMEIPQPVKDAFQWLGDSLSSVGSAINEVFQLQWSDALLVGGALVASAFCPPLAVALGVIEGISLAIRGIGWAISPCVEEIDVLAGVSEETASRCGTAFESLYDIENQVAENDWANRVVSQEDVDRIATSVEDIKNTILNNLDANRNEELASIDALGGLVDEDTLESMRASVNEKYDQMISDTESAAGRIAEIYQSANAENRDLTQGEVQEITKLRQGLQDTLIAQSGATEEELASINEAIKNNDEASALEAAQSVIQQAIRTRDETVAAAWDQYRGQVAAAEGAREAGDISEEEYNRIVAAAETMRDETVSAANDAYYGENGVLASVTNGLGESSNKLDTETGAIKNNWQVFWDDVSGWASTTWNDISAGASQWAEDTGKAIDEKCAEIGTNWNSFWSDVQNGASKWWNDTVDEFVTTGENLRNDWNTMTDSLGSSWDTFCSGAANAWTDFSSGAQSIYDNYIQPFFAEFNQEAEQLGSDIARFLSDPVGAVKEAWEGISGWFSSAVGDPFTGIFNGICQGIEGGLNNVIDLINSFGIDIPDWVPEWGGRHIGLSIPHVSIPRFAAGGFPTKGQLFVAREAGPEMVGQINGQTAVANNQQIVEGIEEGVFRAMMSAIPYMSGEDKQGDVVLTLVLDNEVLARSTAKGQASLARRGAIKTQVAY